MPDAYRAPSWYKKFWHWKKNYEIDDGWQQTNEMNVRGTTNTTKNKLSHAQGTHLPFLGSWATACG